MAFEHYIPSGSDWLRCGYTTGTCAALAAAGAARLLLTGKAPETVRLTTPKGWVVELPPAECLLDGEKASCAVRKDAGDDPDVTDGCLIRAEVCRIPHGITVDGGEGIGRVTKPGLDQPVGAAAINSVPRRMIREAVEEVCTELDCGGGLSVVISVPGGGELAKKTFNPMLGIEGGISILGTSGVVEPMSEQALIETVRLSIRQAAALGNRRVILTPGSYGEAFLREYGLADRGIPIVKCSNYIGEALDAAVTENMESALLVGHIGKLVKLAGGIMNTHSRQADCRAELVTAHAALCGADKTLCRALMDAVTTDACLGLLDEASLRESVLESLLASIQRHLERRTADKLRIGALLFSNVYGALGATKEAKRILKEWSSWCTLSERDPARPI